MESHPGYSRLQHIAGAPLAANCLYRSGPNRFHDWLARPQGFLALDWEPLDLTVLHSTPDRYPGV